MGGDRKAEGRDLSQGLAEEELPEGELVSGQLDGVGVLLVRRQGQVHAIGSTCTHYGGPLGEGLVVGETIRCPWHHACFSLRTGEALGAPALDPVAVWEVERRGGRFHLGRRMPGPAPDPELAGAPESVVIVGAGAAGHAAAEQLRRKGYAGSLTMIDRDADEPVDRPNLSKDYLAGNAPAEWIPLRPPSFFKEHAIERVTAGASGIDLANRAVSLGDGTTVRYDRLLIATGARPVTLPASLDPGSRARYLRSLADSRAIIAAAGTAKAAVVIGASFIGLEVAASLRARGLSVDVVAPEPVPLARILGDDLGRFVRATHEEHGVRFHLGSTVTEIAGDAVVLSTGERLPAGLVVAGIGVRPEDGLARAAGLQTDDGIVVDSRLETSAPAVYAAGDVARFPEPRTGRLARIEHWVVAERMGQCAARNMLGANEPFADAPFFWSQHYDAVIAYVGHAPEWDAAELDGSPADRDCAVRFLEKGRLLALATIFRDGESLRAEVAIEEAARADR